MRQFLLFLIFPLFFFNCGDGDVIDFELVFDQDLDLCGDINSENYLVYDIRTDPDESIMLLFPGSTTNDKIFYPEETPYSGSLSVNGSSIRFNYRAYNGNPLDIICQDIPSSEVDIVTDYEASSGTINFETSYSDDNNVRTVTTIFTVSNSDLEIITADEFLIGTYVQTFTLED